MASLPQHATVTVTVVPDVTCFHITMRAELINTLIQSRWDALAYKMSRDYATELRAVRVDLNRVRDWIEVLDEECAELSP